jgi:hypothetical protein
MKKQEWTYGKGSGPHFQSMVYDQETGQNVAVCYNDEGGKNALLISKAPELLQALKDVDQWIRGFIVKPAFTNEALKAVQEAINNATQP